MEASLEKGKDGVSYLQLGKYRLRLDLEPLEGEYLQRATEEQRESAENYENGLKALKECIKNEEGLYLPLDDNDMLLKFLRPCKFYVESAFKLMKKYYKFKAKNQKYCSDLYPKTVERQYEEQVIDFIPNREKGTRLMIINTRKWSPKDYGVEMLFKAIILAIEIAMIEPKTQVSGVHVILDLMNLKMTHMLQFTPSLAKLIMDFVQYCIPVRLKGIHVVNQPAIFTIGYAVFKPFLNEKFRKRLKFHGTNWKALHEHISPENLPVKYGGLMEYPENAGKLLAELLQLYDDQYKTVDTYGYQKEQSCK